MNFAQEMSALSPDQVLARISGRLRDGKGPAWNESQGEPLWGLLLSAFDHWRRSKPRLQAVDACLNQLVPDLFRELAWPAAEAACAYVLALDNLEDPWHPSELDRWPFKDWLLQPTQAAVDVQLQAMGSALRLMRHRKLVREDWASQNFLQVAAKVSGLDGSAWAIYLVDSWKAWAEATCPYSGVVGHKVWFDLLRQSDQFGASALGTRALALAMDWALGRCSAAERDAMTDQLMIAIGQLSPAALAAPLSAASAVTARLAALEATNDVLGDFAHYVANKPNSRPSPKGMSALRNRNDFDSRLSQPCLLRA